MAEHPYIRIFDRIAALDITTQERAILWVIARYANWDTVANAYPSIETLQARVGLGRRQVYQYLSWLQCDPERAASGRCLGGPKCPHRGLLGVTPGEHGRPTVYALQLEEFVRQPMLPEVAPLRAPRRAAADRDHGQYDRFILRS